MSEPDARVKLARLAVENYIRQGNVIDVPEEVPAELRGVSAGVFVCMKIDGELRGCIGTIEPALDSLAEEIIANAISAAVRDPRFPPVDVRELPKLEYTVDVLTPPEEVSDLRELDPKQYGVIVQSGSRRGLLLPDLEGVDTVEKQIDIARHKAFIESTANIKLYRFEVNRYK
jgi:AmmeMemoRadiSam system protein A